MEIAIGVNYDEIIVNERRAPRSTGKLDEELSIFGGLRTLREPQLEQSQEENSTIVEEMKVDDVVSVGETSESGELIRRQPPRDDRRPAGEPQECASRHRLR